MNPEEEKAMTKQLLLIALLSGAALLALPGCGKKNESAATPAANITEANAEAEAAKVVAEAEKL